MEHTFHLGLKVSFWTTTFVLQIQLDVALELIKFGENRYDRHLENHMSIELLRNQLNLDMPFLFGQISAKYFESSDGRLLSIAMQYLRRNVQYL